LRRADAIVALGACMKERLLAKGVAGERIEVIPNWADGSQILPIPREGNPFRSKHGLEGKFVVLYSGNMGRAHDFTAILAGMQELAAEKEIVFVFVGEGQKRKDLEEFLRTHPEVNARVLDYMPREELRFSMGAADLSIVAVADGLDGLVVPSKLYGIMASGRPALYVGPANSEAARAIAAHQCGFIVGNQESEAFAHAIRRAWKDEGATQQMGKAARVAFEREYDRPVATRRYFELLSRMTKVC
jgi:colanic acid biosynthesis glycosyl transferase WcaI